MILVSFPLSASQTTTVYNYTGGAGGTLTMHGTLADDLSAFVISPDGATAYAYFAAGGGTVRKYDLTNPRCIPADRPASRPHPRGRSSTR